MGKLTKLKPTLTKLEPRIGYASTVTPSAKRWSSAPWLKWYNTKRWRDSRWATLTRDLFTCRMCGKLKLSHELVADHIIPHRGRHELFFCEIDGLQTLCKDPCHAKVKQREEQEYLRGVWD